ncbi:MAG: c-type cytochrome [Candidatus Kryptonium sp.]
MREKILLFILVFIVGTFLSGKSDLIAIEGKGDKKSEKKVIKACDGETQVVLNDVAKDEVMSREKAQEVATMLLATYQQQKKYQSTKFTRRDSLIWERELKAMIEEGYKWFHDPSLGTNGISCDMCHPDAADTHPETYPKFQIQLKKVALLRDMINWCIENPMEGKPLKEDDPRMKAMEAYIIWARATQDPRPNAKILNPGKR